MLTCSDTLARFCNHKMLAITCGVLVLASPARALLRGHAEAQIANARVRFRRNFASVIRHAIDMCGAVSEYCLCGEESRHPSCCTAWLSRAVLRWIHRNGLHQRYELRMIISMY